MKQPEFLQAPSENGGILLWPREDLFPPLLEANRQGFHQSKVEILGKPLVHWRAFAREEINRLARSYLARETNLEPISTDMPLLLSGHQPELFHPGVWVKNFVLNHLARQQRMLPLNLIVDNDVPKSAALMIPHVGDTDHPTSITRIPFAQSASEAPYEDWVLHDRKLFHDLPRQALQICSSWKEQPILAEFWTEAAKSVDEEGKPGVAFAKARRVQERKLGVTNLELPISILADAESFQVFVFHLLNNAESFLQLHNLAVVEYRQRHSLRSKNHPFAELASGQGWVETPFWILHPDSPRRQRLGVKREADGEMRLGTPGPQGIRLSLGQSDPRAELSSLSRRGFRIRPRAIATTLFARLFLADAFLHGIGGGKYDEVTNQLCATFFGCPAPGYLVASATLRLNLLEHLLDGAEVEAAQHLWRDSLWNPQRHAPALLSDRWKNLVAKKQELLALPQLIRQERQTRYHCLRQNLEELQVFLGEHLGILRLEAGRVRNQFHLEQMVQSREFSFALFSEDRLRKLFAPFLP